MNNPIDLYLEPIQALLVKLSQQTDKKYKGSLRKSLRRMIQHLSDLQPILCSVEAKKILDEKGLDPNKLSRYNIGKKVGGRPNRPNLLPEHTTPIKELMDLLSESPIDQTRTILESYSPTCWVTVQENDRLNKAGYKMKRPGGWKVCYEKCEIFFAD